MKNLFDEELTYDEKVKQETVNIANNITFENCHEVAYHLAHNDKKAAEGMLKELKYYLIRR